MRATLLKKILPVVLAVLAVVAFGAVAFVLGDALQKTKKDFKGELEKRLVSEESLLKAQSERAAMESQLESLRAQLAEKKAEAAELSKELEREKELKAATDEALRRVQKQMAALKASAEPAVTESTVSSP
jgi:septal ring factor EnvC (AmiA/AmiB activator)